MKIVLLTSVAGERFSFPPGKIVDWKPDAEAKRYVKSEQARIPTAAELALFDEQEAAKEKAAKAAAAQEKKDKAKVKAADTKRKKAEVKPPPPADDGAQADDGDDGDE